MQKGLNYNVSVRNSPVILASLSDVPFGKEGAAINVTSLKGFVALTSEWVKKYDLKHITFILNVYNSF